MRLERAQSRQRWRELRDMVNAWDPVGLMAIGAPPDEYEDIVSEVLRALERRESAQQLAASLTGYIPAQYGSGPRDPSAFAAQAVEWYESRWPDSAV